MPLMTSRGKQAGLPAPGDAAFDQLMLRGTPECAT
jgi:hypothetical protein